MPLLFLKDGALKTYKFFGKNSHMQRLLATAEQISQYDVNVFITGESGTGKSMLGRYIHERSLRKTSPLIIVNCGSLNDSLLESELFGHVKGSFTNALHTRAGKIEAAQSGTMILDDITSSSLIMQTKLLHVFENKQIQRVGDNRDIDIDVRFICTSNKNVKTEVREGRFREDLYYRVNEISIQIPPLRDRKDDIIPFAEHFIRRFEIKYSKKIKGLTKEAERKALSYDWPGNIRELKNVIARSIVLAKNDELDLDCIFPSEKQLRSNAAIKSVGCSLRKALEQYEKSLICDALKRHRWDYQCVCREMDISRSTLFNKINKYKINKRFQTKE